jgi:U3 small nucleolar RNA-associated protein 10
MVKKKGVSKRNSKATPTTVEGVVSEILRTFVDAVPHIPDHRRLMLFSHLIETVGSSDYLHAAMGLLVEKQVLQTEAASEGKVRAFNVYFLCGY